MGSVRLDLIERKLQAIRDKDVAEIVSKEVPLPISSFASVDDWLQARVVVLERAKELPESAIQDEIAKLYQILCEGCKKIADDMVGDLPREVGVPCGKDYETFIGLHLYRFSLGLFS